MSSQITKSANKSVACAGFTIIEMVVTIVVSSILAIGIVGFIGDAVSGIDSASNRNQLASAGRVAIDRLAMELHNALPNSIRVTVPSSGDQCIEFIPVRAATSYIDPPFGALGDITFDVVRLVPDQEGVSGGYAVIFPNRIGQIYDGENVTDTGFPIRGPIEEIDDIQDSDPASVELSEVTLVSNHSFRRRSPNQRFFVVDQPVSYCVKGGKLYRYQQYGFHDVQTSTEEDALGVCGVSKCLPSYFIDLRKILITDSIDNTAPDPDVTAFTINSQTLNRNSLVSIVLNLAADGDTVILNHSVLTRSVP